MDPDGDMSSMARAAPSFCRMRECHFVSHASLAYLKHFHYLKYFPDDSLRNRLRFHKRYAQPLME